MSTPEELVDYRSDFTPDENFGMFQRAFDIYRQAPAPLEARTAWVRDSHSEDFIVGAIVEHPEPVQPRAPRAWIVVGASPSPRDEPELEIITELTKVDDLVWLPDQYPSSEGKQLKTVISDLAYFTLRKAIAGRIDNSIAGRLVWGITGNRLQSPEDLRCIDAQELVDLAYDLTNG